MVNLEGKKPFIGKVYQEKETGWLAEVKSISRDGVVTVSDRRLGKDVRLETFYNLFKRSKENIPAVRSEIENE